MKKIWEIAGLDEFKSEYENMFSHHTIDYKSLGGNDCILSFAEQNKYAESLKFLYVDGILTITGDYGSAIFNWHNKSNHILAHLKFNSLGYIMEKCVARDENDVKGFDSDLAVKEFQDILDENEVEYEEEIPYFESAMHRDAWMYENANSIIDEPYETGLYTVGDYLQDRVYIWWFAFHKALNLLEEELLATEWIDSTKDWTELSEMKAFNNPKYSDLTNIIYPVAIAAGFKEIAPKVYSYSMSRDEDDIHLEMKAGDGGNNWIVVESYNGDEEYLAGTLSLMNGLTNAVLEDKLVDSEQMTKTDIDLKLMIIKEGDLFINNILIPQEIVNEEDIQGMINSLKPIRDDHENDVYSILDLDHGHSIRKRVMDYYLK